MELFVRVTECYIIISGLALQRAVTYLIFRACLANSTILDLLQIPVQPEITIPRRFWHTTIT